MMNSQTHTDLNEQLISDWEKLWHKSKFANIVNSPFWTIAAQKAFSGNQLRIITIYNNTTNELLAVAAFTKKKVNGIPVWTIPADEFANKTSLLVDFKDQKVARLFLKELFKLGTIYLTELTEDQIREIQRNTRAFTTWKHDVNPYIDFSKGKYGNMPNRRINNLFNRIKTAKIDMKLITTNNENSKKTLETCFSIETTSAKQSKGKSVFHRDDVKEFYRNLVGLNPSSIPVSILYFNDKPVSYLIGFLVNNIYQGSQKAYLTGFEYFNPGKLALIKVLDFYKENGNPAIELGRGSDRFKRDFTSDFQVLYNLIISKNNFIRIYIKNINTLKEILYKQFQSNLKLYLLYKNANLFISKRNKNQ